MAQPPIDAPVLFDVQGKNSKIKHLGDGSYKLVMKDVERVHWKTDDAEAEEGYYGAKKYAKSYDTYYGKDAEVSAYETFTLADGSKEKCKFTVTDVKYNQKSNKLVYDITPKNKKQAEKITGLEGEIQVEGALYSTESTRWTPDWMPHGRRMNLSGADLSYADMRGARLDSTRLDNANLSHADLAWARLTRADLWRANLRGVDLHKAHLVDVYLRGADLRDADLHEARLVDVDLRGADLTRADTSYRGLWGADAIWGNTICPDGTKNSGTSPCTAEQRNLA